MDITQLLTFGVEQNASDCHLSSGEPPMLRVNGDLKKLDLPALSQEGVHGLVYDIMNDVQRKIFEETLECDFSFEMGGLARFRVNVFMQRKGEAAVFRTIPTKILSLEQLGMPAILKQLCEKEKGLILVTGPTGSGKSDAGGDGRLSKQYLRRSYSHDRGSRRVRAWVEEVSGQPKRVGAAHPFVRERAALGAA
jgi:twitching motility protein PilT